MVEIGGSKTRSSVRDQIYAHCGRQCAKQLFRKKQKVSPIAFEHICWDTVGSTMATFPDTFQDWVTRHTSDFNGCNRYLSRWADGVKNICQSCGCPNENTAHIVRCTHPIRSTLYFEGVDEITSWLKSNHTPTDIVNLYSRYLRGRGNTLMTSLLHPSSVLLPIATAQDSIGYDNLIVGRLPKSLISHMSPILQAVNKRSVYAERWAKDFSKALIMFTHRQWIHRNNITHYKPSEGKTVAEHNLVDTQVQSLLSLPPTKLLPQHRYLLTTEDFSSLGASSTATKQFWIADVEAAITEAALTKHLQKRSRRSKTANIVITRGKTKIAVRNINSSLFSYKKIANKCHKQRRQRKHR